MVTNFEFHTKDISEDEKKNIFPLIDILSKTKSNDQVLTPRLVLLMNAYNVQENRPKVNGRKIRKLVNHIRKNGIAAIIATSSGYYLTNDHQEIESQIQSLRERASSINDCAKGLEKILNHMQ
jgi:hypothetical protein